MKKLNLLRLLFGAMFLIAATAFTSCVDDNDDDGMPYLEVAPEALTFSAEGVAEGASAVTVKSNRPWTLAFESGADWVTPSATDGKAGTTEVEFSIPASNESRTATLSFQLKNSYGAYFTKTVTINQGEVVPEKLVYKETFGTTGDKTPVASYDGWDKTGEGSSTVTYAGEGVDIRSNLSSVGNGSAYEGSGGSNLMFGTGNTYFTVQDITLPQGQTGYTLTFGASYFNAPNIEIYDQLTVQFSKDGEKWTNVIPYTFENFVAEKNWNLATLNFTLKEFSEHLYIKFLSTKKPDGNYRIDDVTLVTSAGGQQVDLDNGSVTPPVGDVELPTTVVTQFGDSFNDVISGVVYDSPNWAFTSSDAGYPANPKLGWFGSVFGDTFYLQCAPYSSTQKTVTAYAIMTPFNVKAADNKVLTFKLAWYFNATASAADDSKIEIVASTTVTNETITEPSVWTVVKTIEYKEGVNEINVYFDESADLSAYAASDKVYVAFRYVGHNNTYRLDDVSFNGGATGSLVVDPTAISLGDAAGATAKITVTSTGDWKATVSGSGFSIDKTTGTASDTSITVTASEANASSEIKNLGSIVVSNDFGTKTIAVSQKGVSNDIFYESFGDLEQKLDKWPYINESPYVIRSGFGYVSGTSDYKTAYASNRWTATTASPTSAGFSGKGLMWLQAGKKAYFTVQDLVLTTEKNLSIRFGLYGNTDAFDPQKDVIKLYLSSDAENWTEIAYNLENVDATPAWKWASADITLKNTVSRLSLKIEYPSGATGTRVDDVRIFVGTGGTEIDLGGGAATPAVTTANASNVAETTVTLGGSIANADLADYSAVGVEYVVFATGNTPDWTGSVKVPAATKAATWTVDVTGLTKETQYAFRAYATPNTGDILYGDHKTFITTGGGSVTAITIPELLQIAKGSVISESQDKVLTAVVCGDPSGNNFSFGTLYVMTEGATEGGNGIVIYNKKSADFNVADYALGDRLKITLQANVAMMDEYNGVKQITGVTTYHVEKSGTATVTPINVAPADLASYVSMPATVQQASTAKAGVWCTASSIGNHTFTSGGTNFTVNVNKRATVFQDIPYAAVTGNITGIVTMYGGKGQIAPRNLNDVEAFKVTVPTITEVTPSSLVWTANDTSEKTVTIEGVNFNGFTLSSLTSFNASVEGTTVKISPKAVNTSDAELKETLTITANGGNSVTVTLTQNGASSGTKLTITITPTTADSGFPATAPTTEATATIDGYVWGLLNAKQNAGYLMINGTNGYLATPAVPGSTLKTIKITTSNDISASAKVTIKDTSDNIVSPEQAVGDKNTEYTFNLTNPAAGVSYRINSSNKKTQLVKVELSYE
ncbi:DUF5689 domain-containing protein [Alistipes finegoldii]|uniref:DUF5689 domain-containing protein n=1 Tax=Alistipes finegoldii TaxID=214856 RepID=UPI002432C2A8|nr:DUF5689 domain-containing protein [Alistipes finegoldii]